MFILLFNRRLFSLMGAVVFGMLIVYSIGNSAEESLDTTISRDIALQKVVRIFGLEEKHVRLPAAASESIVELVVIADSTTPFLAKQFDGSLVWQVTFNNVIIRSDNVSQDLVRDVRFNFKIFMDAKSGQLLYIESKTTEYNKFFRPLPSSARLEARMKARREKYVGLPDEEPIVSFTEALSEYVAGAPHLAKEIIAHYVLYESDNFGGPIPVWSIQLRGLPYDKAISKESKRPADYLSYIRTVINARTGKQLFIDNLPYP